MSKANTIDVVTLGCSKNLVDSERLLAMLRREGFTPRHDPEEGSRPARTVVINTCGFINDAKEESINTILTYCQEKARGTIDRIIVMGCLSQRYMDDLPNEITEVDQWFGKFDWDGVVAYIKQAVAQPADTSREVTTGPSNAYLKIAEGCNRFCAFCAIPLITGRFTSRTIESLVEEARALAREGVTELNVIAQDLSSYGLDIYGRHALAELIERLSQIDELHWIRLHYAYPSDFPYDILEVMRNNPKVCKYLDIALQHIADPVLKNMRRHISADETRRLLRRIREEVPGIHIRTTLMVGFPGEGEEEFNQLLEFVKEARFERMGAFAYSEEEDTFAARNFSDDIPEEVKQQRLQKLMDLQAEIALELQLEKVGREIEVVIDREENDYYVGRSEFDSPEVDPEVLVSKTTSLTPGQYVKVKVTEALPFELIATPS